MKITEESQIKYASFSLLMFTFLSKKYGPSCWQDRSLRATPGQTIFPGQPAGKADLLALQVWHLFSKMTAR